MEPRFIFLCLPVCSITVEMGGILRFQSSNSTRHEMICTVQLSDCELGIGAYYK
jgi:hypothetical protein